MECKVEGCTGDASSAPKAGPTARLCATHRAERSAEISAARTGKPRGGAGVSLGGGNGSRQKRSRTAVTRPKRGPGPRKDPPAVAKTTATPLATIAAELEEAATELDAARERHSRALAAFVNHHVVKAVNAAAA